MPFHHGISHWGTPSPGPEHDHVGLMVGIDGSANDPNPGAWDLPTGTVNASVQNELLGKTEEFISRDYSVVLRFVGWRQPHPGDNAPTQRDLYAGSGARGPSAYAAFLKEFLFPFRKYDVSRIRVEPFSEFGFLPDCTEDREEANQHWWPVACLLHDAVQEMLPGVGVVIGTPAYDAGAGSWCAYPCGPKIRGDGVKPTMILPCHFYEPRVPLDRAVPGLSYPSPPGKPEALGDWEILDGLLPWNYEGLLSALLSYKTHCHRHGFTPYVGEWGSNPASMTPFSAAVYDADMVRAMEAAGLDRCKWVW